jgi:hypothetical protein
MAPRFLTILTGRNLPKIRQSKEPEESSETRAIMLLISLDSEHLQVWPDDGFAVDLTTSVEQEVGGSSPPNCTRQINNLAKITEIENCSGVTPGVTIRLTAQSGPKPQVNRPRPRTP